MTIYTVKLKNKMEVAKDTMAFIFEKPQGFNFKPGQWGDFTILNPRETDAEGNTRGFSLASPSYESDLMFATRMRNTAFKRCLKELPIGTELKLDGPGGSFMLHNNETVPAVFLTGGIGITPVRSILMQAANNKSRHKLYLFYSNETPEAAAFLEELTDLQKKNPNFKFIATMTNIKNSSTTWNGESGRIDKNMLLKYIGDISKPIYYISGPKAMVASMRSILNEAGVNDDNIRTEEFSGY